MRGKGIVTQQKYGNVPVAMDGNVAQLKIRAIARFLRRRIDQESRLTRSTRSRTVNPEPLDCSARSEFLVEMATKAGRVALEPAIRNQLWVSAL